MAKYVMALDAGTTSNRWVEQDADEIWATQ